MANKKMHNLLDDMEGLDFKSLTIHEFLTAKRKKRKLAEKEEDAIRNEKIKADIDKRWAKPNSY